MKEIRQLMRKMRQNAYTILIVIGMFGALLVVISFFTSGVTASEFLQYDWTLDELGQNGVILCLFSYVMMLLHTICKFIDEKIFKITF